VRWRPVLFALLAVLLSPPLLAEAQESLKSYHTRYTEILYSRDRDLVSFTSEIGRGLGSFMENPGRNPALIRNRVDGIVDTTLRLLDMRPATLRFSIHVYEWHADLEQAYRRTGMTGAVPVAFYAHQNRTISVSLEKVSARILAHEIAHAAISAYFSPPPPARMQEVLAQYVDEHLED
jgi:hypothetical protein